MQPEDHNEIITVHEKRDPVVYTASVTAAHSSSALLLHLV